MTLSKFCIYGGGLLTLIMAVFHTRFYGLFKWEEDFSKMTQLNPNIFYTIHLALLLLFFIIAALSFLYGGELGASSGLAMGLNIGIVLFWLWRWLWQIFYFSKMKGVIHYTLIIYFFLLALCYAVPVAYKLTGRGSS